MAITIIRSIWRSGLVAFLIIPVIAILSAPLQSMAQQVDIAAAQKRFQDLYAAGDYSAALAEAQKTEAAAKRSGTNNFTYVSALNDLARAHQALGRYAEAAGMFKQVVGTLAEESAAERSGPGSTPRQPGHGVFAAGQSRRRGETVQASTRHLDQGADRA